MKKTKLSESLREAHMQIGAQANEVENLKAALSKTQIELREERQKKVNHTAQKQLAHVEVIRT
jgi:hypothetical protein